MFFIAFLTKFIDCQLSKINLYELIPEANMSGLIEIILIDITNQFN